MKERKREIVRERGGEDNEGEEENTWLILTCRELKANLFFPIFLNAFSLRTPELRITLIASRNAYKEGGERMSNQSILTKERERETSGCKL